MCPGESVSLVINRSLMGQDSGGVCQGAHFIQNIMTLNMIPCLLLPCVMLYERGVAVRQTDIF